MEYLKIYLYGIIILVSGIILNWIATSFGLTTWYDFLKNNFVVRNNFSYVWLFVIYPIAFGLIVYLLIRNKL